MSPNSSSTTETAKEQARHVQESASEATSQLAGTAKDQAQNVAEDVRHQARQLADETGQQLNEQARGQRDRAVSGLRSLGDELDSMSSSTEKSGLGAQLAREGSSLTHQVADFLEDREPGQLVDELRQLARRRPGAFLVGAAAAGVVVGRFTRGAMSARNSSTQTLPGDANGETYQSSDLTPPITNEGKGVYDSDAEAAESILDEPYSAQPSPSGHPTSGRL
jgi:vacuolar-type H+-ATPase subunit H